MAASGFTIPNEPDAGHAHQARVFETDIDILVAGIQGDGVMSGCAVTDNASGLTVDVAAGVVRINGTNVAVASGSVTPAAAHGSNPRFDLVVVDNAGTKSITSGTAAANPVPPAVPANSVCLAALYIRAAASTLATADIVDKRAIVKGSHAVLDSVQSTTSVVSTITETDIYSFTLPTDLAAGDYLRLTLMGDFFNNKGSTGTVTTRLKLGSTTMLASAGQSLVSNANRGRWMAIYDLAVAVAASEQRVAAIVMAGTQSATATLNANTTGYTLAGYGTAAEDLTSAKALKVTIELNVSDANFDFRRHAAILEKIT